MVRPAHISGAASTGGKSSGIRATRAGGRDHVLAVAAVEGDAGDLAVVTQAKKSPRRQWSQYPQ